jgi:hypothetical protein
LAVRACRAEVLLNEAGGKVHRLTAEFLAEMRREFRRKALWTQFAAEEA